jgi:hypothetical protein
MPRQIAFINHTPPEGRGGANSVWAYKVNGQYMP